MLAISIVVLILRVISFIIFTLEFEVALVYVPTIVLIAISIYLMTRGGRSLE